MSSSMEISDQTKPLDFYSLFKSRGAFSPSGKTFKSDPVDPIRRDMQVMFAGERNVIRILMHSEPHYPLQWNKDPRLSYGGSLNIKKLKVRPLLSNMYPSERQLNNITFIISLKDNRNQCSFAIINLHVNYSKLKYRNLWNYFISVAYPTSGATCGIAQFVIFRDLTHNLVFTAHFRIF